LFEMAADAPNDTLALVEDSFVNPRGYTIFTQSIVPSEPKATIVIVHGLGEYSSRYLPIIKFFYEKGYAVYALDHEAHGRSQGEHEYVGALQHLIDDVITFSTTVHTKHAGLPRFILGHSMGGCMSLSVGLQNPDLFDYYIISCPALVRSPNVNAVMQFGGKILASIFPHARPVALDTATLCRDPNVVTAYKQDPLVWHLNVAAKLGSDILSQGDWVIDHAAEFAKPLLIMQGTADEIVGASGATRFFETISSPDKTLLLLENWYHELILDNLKDRLHDFIGNWIADRVALPSGAHLTVNASIIGRDTEDSVTFTPQA